MKEHDGIRVPFRCLHHWRGKEGSRRAFLALLWAAAALPSAQAQSAMQRVGVLFPAGETPGLGKLTDALTQRGYTEGRNIGFEVRSAGRSPEQLPQLARELVARQPKVIVSATTAAAHALTGATVEIPIVLALIGDPIALGLTRSIARPTGNVTGFTTGHETVAGKRLELLREAIPAARKIRCYGCRRTSSTC